MIEYVRTSTINNDSTLFIIFKSGQRSLLLVFNCWREVLEVKTKMKIKAGIILVQVIPENTNPYDKINERNSEWIYLGGYSWTKKAVFLGLFVDCWTLKMKGLRSFETSRTSHPTTQSHFPEVFYLSNIAMRTSNLAPKWYLMEYKLWSTTFCNFRRMYTLLLRNTS
jgi:hypothetical protein